MGVILTTYKSLDDPPSAHPPTPLPRHKVQAFGSDARWLPVNASVEVSGAKL